MDDASKIREAWKKAALVPWPWREGRIHRVPVPPALQKVDYAPSHDYWSQPDLIEIVDFRGEERREGRDWFFVFIGKLRNTEIEVARDVIDRGP